MAIEVERLIATLEARVDKYEKALKKAAGDTDKTFKRIEARGNLLESRLAKIGVAGFRGLATGALAALAPIVSVSAAIRTATEAMQQFGDIADNAKASGLDPEFFQALAYQAQLGGVAFSELSGSLATFAKNSALAVVGKGRMVTALKALNPQLAENIRSATSQEQRIKLVADALSKEADASKRAAIATAAFGEAGAKLSGVFEGGAAQIDAMQVRAQNLGIVVSRDLIAKADELGDEFDTVTKIVDLQLKQAFINIAPILVWLTGLAGDFAKTVNSMVDATKPLEQQTSATIEAQLKALEAAMQQQGPFGLTDVFGVDKAKRDELMGELRRRAMDSLRTQLSAPPAPDTPAIPTLDELEALGRGVQRLHSEYDAWADDGVQTLIDKHKELAETISSEIVGGIRDIWNAFKSGENVLDAILSKVLSIGENMFFSGLQSLLTPNLGGGWNIPTSYVPGGFFPAFPGRAGGGRVNAGQPYRVGEKRPEMFVPESAGRIMPISQARRGGGVTNNVYNYGSDRVETKSNASGGIDVIIRAVEDRIKGNMAKGQYRSLGVSPGMRRT